MIDNYSDPFPVTPEWDKMYSCKVCRRLIQAGEMAQRHKSSGCKHAECQPKSAKNINAQLTDEELRKVGTRTKRHHGRVVRGLNSL